MRLHLRSWNLSVGSLLLVACVASENGDSAELVQSVTIDPTAAYTITAVESNKCVQIESVNATNRAVIGTCNGSPAQRFVVRAVSGADGYFNIVNVTSGLNLDVEGASRADGARVLPWSSNGGQNQQWSITDVSSGAVKLTARHSGKVMEVTAGATADGSELRQRTSLGRPNQEFRLDVAGSDGGGDDPGGGARSAGCGRPTSLAGGNHTIDVNGTRRQYILDIPSTYDPNRAYRLVFGWHWRGGQASDVAGRTNYYGMKAPSNGNAIFVAPDGIDRGWANNGGRDEAFARAMVSHLNANLCIDTTRIFAAGFSFGGMMSNAIGCNVADLFRAIAPMAGALYSGCNTSNTRPIAVWMSHGTRDDVVPISDGRAALDVFLRKNGCSAQTTPVGPSPCVAYQGCRAGYPVTFCAYDGGHDWPGFAGPAIWAFFSQF